MVAAQVVLVLTIGVLFSSGPGRAGEPMDAAGIGWALGAAVLGALGGAALAIPVSVFLCRSAGIPQRVVEAIWLILLLVFPSLLAAGLQTCPSPAPWAVETLVVAMGWTFPLVTYLLGKEIASLAPGPFEAARMDGLAVGTVFFQIVLPGCGRTILTGIGLGMVAGWLVGLL